MDNIKNNLDLVLDQDLTTSEAIDLIKELEKKTKEIKAKQKDQITERINQGNDTTKDKKYKFTKTETSSKILDGSKVNTKFTKTETKPNTKAINEYEKEHGKLPEGISSIYSHDRISIKDLQKERENKEKYISYKKKQQTTLKQNPLKDIQFKKRTKE